MYQTCSNDWHSSSVPDFTELYLLIDLWKCRFDPQIFLCIKAMYKPEDISMHFSELLRAFSEQQQYPEGVESSHKYYAFSGCYPTLTHN